MDEDVAHDQVIPEISPGALLEVMENPGAFSEIARADLYIQMAEMRKQMRDGEPSIDCSNTVIPPNMKTGEEIFVGKRFREILSAAL
jgi:hypothetical protein